MHILLFDKDSPINANKDEVLQFCPLVVLQTLSIYCILTSLSRAFQSSEDIPNIVSDCGIGAKTKRAITKNIKMLNLNSYYGENRVNTMKKQQIA